MQSINSVTAVNYSAFNQEQDKAIKSVDNTQQEGLSPNQPLANSIISDREIWKMVSEANKKLGVVFSGTSKESIETKKMLIDVVKDSRIKQLEERCEELRKQAEAAKNQGIWAKIGMALGFIAAILIAPFNPAVSAVMIGTMVASLVVPKIVDKILEAAGVDESIRKWVSIGLQVGIGLIGSILSFNPKGVLDSLGRLSSKVMSVLGKATDVLKSLKAIKAISDYAKPLINSVLKGIDSVASKIPGFAQGGEMTAARIGQGSSVLSGLTDVVSTGYSIKSAAIAKNLEVDQAEQQELETTIAQIQKLLDNTLKLLRETFTMVFDVKNAEREYFQNATNVNM